MLSPSNVFRCLHFPILLLPNYLARGDYSYDIVNAVVYGRMILLQLHANVVIVLRGVVVFVVRKPRAHNSEF